MAFAPPGEAVLSIPVVLLGTKRVICTRLARTSRMSSTRKRLENENDKRYLQTLITKVQVDFVSLERSSEYEKTFGI